MKKLLLASLLIFGFLQQGNAQRFDYDNSSNVFVGLNVGYVWHSSDVKNVKNRFPLGAGFTLGGTFNRDYGKILTYDLRFRFLFGSWYGQDRDTTHAIQDNYAVNNFYDTLGYTVQNFRAKQRSFDLEFAVHFNRVKEKTGLDPYIFGGIGFTFTNTQGNLLKDKDLLGEGIIYPYNEDPTGGMISKDYSTPLDKNISGAAYDGFEANFLPSLGVGIGYYFTSNFSVGLEHRTTFFNGDYFDGTHLNQDGQPSKIKNDWFHYSSIYFKWYLRKSKNNWENPKDEVQNPINKPVTQNPKAENPKDKDKPVVDRTPVTKRPPIINFTNPSKNPLKVSQPLMTIRAEVKYVKSSENLNFTQNGVEHGTFIYNPNTNVFESKVNLVLGKNVFNLTGYNSDGNASDETVVIFESEAPKDAYPPTVNIVDPVNSPYNVNQLNYIVKAAIHNIKARNQLTVTFNNEPFFGFSFNPDGAINFSANLNLKSGINTLKIVGTNSAGTDKDETVLVYARKPIDNEGNPPVVSITIPNKNPYTTSKTEVDITAKINYIENNQQVEVVINGVNTSNFTYNSNTRTVQFIAGLSTGYNNIRVKAKNAYGTDMDDIQITCQPGFDPHGSNFPPVVSITTPNTNPYTTQNSTQAISAKVEHIDSKEQLEIKVNGVETTSFTLSASKIVQFNVNLTNGSNTISIIATNNFGSDSDVSQIIYREKIQRKDPPKIKIFTPEENPFTTSQATEKVVAKVEDVNLKNQITVKINGVNTLNFSFESSTKLVKVDANLSLGTNTINISATNEFGSATGATQILRVIKTKPTINEGIKELPCIYPSIVYVSPSLPITTVTKGAFEVIAKLNGIKNKNQIKVFVNSIELKDFSFDTSTNLLNHTIHLEEVKTTYKIRLVNECGPKEGGVFFEYEAPVCGVDVALDKSDFCASTPGHMVNRNELLTNTSFQYNGPAKSIYFQAAENGLALVNGEDYPLIKGIFYHFIGTLTLDIKRINDQWHVCVESDSRPIFGSGSTKPESPCEGSIEDNLDKGSKEADTIKEDVKSKTNPEVKPVIETQPGKTTKPVQRTPKVIGTQTPDNEESSPATKPATRPAGSSGRTPRTPTGGG